MKEHQHENTFTRKSSKKKAIQENNGQNNIRRNWGKISLRWERSTSSVHSIKELRLIFKWRESYIFPTESTKLTSSLHTRLR